ncbi:MAG: hypothetical protein P8N51_17045 [Pseudomonadales bacterium]|nr:hypothetical protein [Pseudomonadales bacterium]MDG1444603.1 hypothetical protein [Pseudomonadales bacterium]
MKEQPKDLALPNSAQDILSNAKKIAPWLTQKSDEIEQARRLPNDVVDIVKKTGVFRMNMPTSWSGPQATSPEQVEIIESLSIGDASVGWCAMIGSDSGIYSGYLDDQIARDLYPSLDTIQAGWIYPVGMAEEVDGAYKVSGNWHYLSGSTHTDMVAAGCRVFKDGEPVFDSDGTPEWRIILAPVDHWQITDDWHTTGLKGSASNAYSTVSRYLVAPRTHSFSFKTPVREGLLWQKPDTLLRNMSGVPLGAARGAINDFKDIMDGKYNMLRGTPYKGVPRIQSSIAEAEMKLSGARSYVYDALGSQWRCLEDGIEPSVTVRKDVWLSRLNAFQTARDVSRLLYDALGGDAIYTRKSRLDRAMRDTETMCQHWVGQKVSMESVGEMLFDVDGPGPRSIML